MRSFSLLSACVLLYPALLGGQTPSWTLSSTGGVAGSAGATVTQTSPVVDAMGDEAAILGAPGVLHDIDTVTVTSTPTHVDIQVTFHGNISAPSALAMDSVVGLIELDLDQDSTTGGDTLQSMFSPPLSPLDLGVDAIVLLDSEMNGLVAVTNAGFTPIAFAPISFTPNSLLVSISLIDLGDDGQLDFSTILGTLAQPTDALEVVGSTAPSGPLYLRGDCMNDGVINLTDAVMSLLISAGQTVGPPCLAACDVNGDDSIDLADGVALLNYLFLDGPPPASPFPDCGPAAGSLPCASFANCSN